MAITKGAHHIGLTVLDLTAARNFCIDTFGFKQVGKVPDYPTVCQGFRFHLRLISAPFKVGCGV